MPFLLPFNRIPGLQRPTPEFTYLLCLCFGLQHLDLTPTIRHPIESPSRNLMMSGSYRSSSKLFFFPFVIGDPFSHGAAMLVTHLPETLFLCLSLFPLNARSSLLVQRKSRGGHFYPREITHLRRRLGPTLTLNDQ